jgi:hypothetical protein
MTYNPLLANFPTATISNAQLGTNNTGSTIAAITPVKTTSSGLALVNPTLEADVFALAGITSASISNTATGSVVSAGLIQAITTSFSVGDVVYVSLSGSLTNVKPSIGVGGFVAGNWIIKIGVIALNQTNPLNKDLLVNISVVGQL